MHWNPNSFRRSVFYPFQTSHGCCRRNRLLHLRRQIEPCFQAIFLCLEFSVAGKYLLNRKLHQFLMLSLFFSFAQSTQNLTVFKVLSNLCRLELDCPRYHHYTWWERHQPLYGHICKKNSQKPHVWSLLLIFCHELVRGAWHTVLWNPASKII